MKYQRILAVGAAAAITVLSATSARADTVYNDLDASVDSALEIMNLTYDTGTSTGSSSTTRLRIQIDGHLAGDHPGCNIQGGPHYVALLAHSGNTSVATVSLPADRQFDGCADSIVATVTARGIGSTNITFSIDQQNTSNDPNLTFSLVEASFTVNVTAGTTGGSRCDADPAAPAWAAAILKANGVKPGSAGFKNYISEVAGAMTKGAVFGTYVKNAHPQYENAVLTFLKGETGNQGLVMGRKPGWTCRSVS